MNVLKIFSLFLLAFLFQAQAQNSITLDRIAFLDDLKEQVKTQIELNELTEISFAAASIIHLGTFLTNSVELKFEKIRPGSDAFSGLNKLTKISRLGKLTANTLTTTSLPSFAFSKDEIILLSRQDVPELLSVIEELRHLLQASLTNGTSKYQDYSKEILKKRPSYLKIYSECSQDPDTYQIDMMIETYRSSLNNYFSLLLLSPDELQKQIHSKGISHSLHTFINQETTTHALFDCFQSREKELSFIKKLFAMDLTAKVVVLSTIGTIAVGAKYALGFISKLKFPSYISPVMARKLLTITSIATSSIALYSLKKKYQEFTSRNSVSKDYMKSRIINEMNMEVSTHLESLESLSLDEKLSTSEKLDIHQQITQWKQFQRSYN